MKVLLDTSTLIAAMLPDHTHHCACHAWLSQAKSEVWEFVVAGHSVAEVYSVLTRLPRTPRISPAEAARLVRENVVNCAQSIALTAQDYSDLVHELSQRSVGGGLVYDAIIARSAELAQVDRLVTLNVEHFRQVWPAGANRISSPLQESPPR